MSLPAKRPSRAVISIVKPSIDCGQYFIKRVIGEKVDVYAAVFADGHDVVAAEILYKHESDTQWSNARLNLSVNDDWYGSFVVEKQRFYHYKVRAWVDYALNWQSGLIKKALDGQYVQVELNDGLPLLEETLKLIPKSIDSASYDFLKSTVEYIKASDYLKSLEACTSKELKTILEKYPTRKNSVESPEYKIWVDRPKAGFSAWYEFFPRSASPEKGRHGTFKDCEALLPRIADLGFDVLYFPPIHPIGEINRKGKNNSVTSKPGEPGSPWAIGSRFGGHDAIHPELGTLEDYKNLLAKAKEYGIEIAMDLAFQCAPDHPYVKEHPEWFVIKSDGSIQYAENPPKKYQDIYPFNFECDDWQGLWNELLRVVKYWVEQGVTIFRVDNPHTKPFKFWQWLISEIHKTHSDIIFLSEAFTRPKIMHELAKLGFTQSYTYFCWRNTKAELTEYLTELTTTDQREFFRPNFWPNTPDINPWSLQGGNESLFMIRLFLAATLSSNYGIYGPVYEYGIHEPYPGKEEYLNSEKYEIYHWDWTRETRLTVLIRLINQIRKTYKSFQTTYNLTFCPVNDDHLLAYYKGDIETGEHFLMVVNLDHLNSRQGMVRPPFEKMGIPVGTHLLMQDYITGNTWTWYSEYNYVALHPNVPFHLFKISKA
ncbi:alpha-1,4-glucan:maltose-1-phosphate maltosyltransferase [Thermaurantimonas aggregans]|uniref:Alpha-1,4-glucan:maltose-1-phosphate maltosyltransferase n=1 Tax=Thermaurantimonas aggregans TaxID=2173829 RepID=A0A401XIS5_9FLAO|nr:alpha-1,4-glucan--maltose-1-phosphate maltosyltransferase [Thermaurantimonas aggregans]MCX8148836.1 alpha-1,4-glucan--maltose-1-phosphate maltosyltransferase [Thermaurantimonas aggregans]GCD76893.1 alpha-1,4-glucan:maltose-1-phosphate maltosyltransferase [Thermaurantimonas aggregans]